MLVRALRELRIQQGDALMVHASWLPQNGFSGRPADMVGALKETVGSRGLLVMPSMTYHNESSKQFLARGVPMDVRRSPSKMGLLSEVFRRGRDVRRSLSPTHSLLAWGEGAKVFVSGHEKRRVPFGEGTPFARLLEMGGKILSIDAPFSTITFTHFLEDRIAKHLPCPLYEDETRVGTVIGYEGNRLEVPVQVISDVANAQRRERRLVDELERAGELHRKRIGNTRLLLLGCRAMTQCADAMVARGQSFFDPPSSEFATLAAR